MTGDLTVGSEAWLREIFDRVVRADLFPDASLGEPVLVLLGGQPAAGKTLAQERILTEYPWLVSITGDDLRQFHPDYAGLCETDPVGMPGITAPVSGGLVRLALDHALAHGYPVLLEGTFRDRGMVADTASRFAAAGYRVEVVAVATPAPVSRLAAEQRYLGAPTPAQARWTPPDAHENALVASSGVLAALEVLPGVARVRVHARDRVLYENRRTPDGGWAASPGGAEAMRAEQDRSLDPGAAVEWLARYQVVFIAAQSRAGYLRPETLPAYRRLQDDAARMLDLVEAGGADTTAFRDQQRQRRIALGVADPFWSRLNPFRARPGREHPSMTEELERRAQQLGTTDPSHRPPPSDPRGPSLSL